MHCKKYHLNNVFVIIYLVPNRGWSLKLNVAVYRNIFAPLIWFTYAKTVLSKTGVHCCIDHQNINSTKLRHCLKYINFMHCLWHCPLPPLKLLIMNGYIPPGSDSSGALRPRHGRPPPPRSGSPAHSSVTAQRDPRWPACDCSPSP